MSNALCAVLLLLVRAVSPTIPISPTEQLAIEQKFLEQVFKERAALFAPLLEFSVVKFSETDYSIRATLSGPKSVLDADGVDICRFRETLYSARTKDGSFDRILESNSLWIADYADNCESVKYWTLVPNFYTELQAAKYLTIGSELADKAQATNLCQRSDLIENNVAVDQCGELNDLLSKLQDVALYTFDHSDRNGDIKTVQDWSQHEPVNTLYDFVFDYGNGRLLTLQAALGAKETSAELKKVFAWCV